MTTKTSKTMTALALGTLAAALLTGCNNGGSEESADGGVGGTSAAVPSGSATGTASKSASASPSAGGEDPAFTAISTVEADGGKVVGLDRQDDGEEGFKIEVLDKGTLYEVKVDTSGKNPEPRKKATDDGKGAQKAAQATVPLAEALRTARTEVPGKNIDEAELDDEGGKAVWKIELDVDNQGSSDVLVDAASGAVVK